MGLNQTQVREVEVSVDRPKDRAVFNGDAYNSTVKEVSVGSSSFATRTIVSAVPETRYLERITFTFTSNPTNEFDILIRVRDGTDTDLIREFANPQNMPLDFDPAIKLEEGWDVLVRFHNFSASASDVSAAAGIRAEVER